MTVSELIETLNRFDKDAPVTCGVTYLKYGNPVKRISGDARIAHSWTSDEIFIECIYEIGE